MYALNFRVLLHFFTLYIISECKLQTNKYTVGLPWHNFDKFNEAVDVLVFGPPEIIDTQTIVFQNEISGLKANLASNFKQSTVAFHYPCNDENDLYNGKCNCNFEDYESKQNFIFNKTQCNELLQPSIKVLIYFTKNKPILYENFHFNSTFVYIIMTSDESFYSNMNVLTHSKYISEQSNIHIYPFSFSLQYAFQEAIRLKSTGETRNNFLQNTLDIIQPMASTNILMDVSVAFASLMEPDYVQNLIGALWYRNKCPFVLFIGKESETFTLKMSGDDVITEPLQPLLSNLKGESIEAGLGQFRKANDRSLNLDALHIRLIFGNFMRFINDETLTEYLTSLKLNCCGAKTYYIWVLPEGEKINEDEFYQTVSGVIIRVPELNSADTIFRVVEEFDIQSYAHDVATNTAVEELTIQPVAASGIKIDFFFVLPKTWNTNMYFLVSSLVENKFKAFTTNYIRDSDIAVGLGTVGINGLCHTHLQPTKKNEIFKYYFANSTFIKKDATELSLSYFECLDFFMTEGNINWREDSRKIFVIFTDSLPNFKSISTKTVSAATLYENYSKHNYKFLLFTSTMGYKEFWKRSLLLFRSYHSYWTIKLLTSLKEFYEVLSITT